MPGEREIKGVMVPLPTHLCLGVQKKLAMQGTHQEFFPVYISTVPLTHQPLLPSLCFAHSFLTSTDI